MHKHRHQTFNNEIGRRVDAIRADRLSGATELTRRSADVLLWLAAESPGDTPFLPLLEDTARSLVSAQPLMAPVFRLANDVLLAVSAVTEENARGAATRSCRELVARIESAVLRVAESAARLIQDEGVILTHSNSEAVRASLLSARAAGKQFEVVCTESRPMREGAALAATLAGAGVRVKLIVDAAAGVLLKTADAFFTGADAVSEAGITNKAGTFGIALLAQSLGRPAYVLCGAEKLLPSGKALPDERPRDPREVQADIPPGVEVANLYFDLTPFSCITAIVTDRGIEQPDAVKRQLRAMPVHHALL